MGAIVNGAITPRPKAAASRPAMASALTATGPVPVLVMAIVARAVVPTRTVPNETIAGARLVLGVVPTPLSASTFEGETGSSDAICTCAARIPIEDGWNTIVNFIDAPTASVTGNSGGAIRKSAAFVPIAAICDTRRVE